MWPIARQIIRDWITPTGAAALIGLALLAWLVSSQTGRIQDDVRSIEVRLTNIETDVAQVREDVAAIQQDLTQIQNDVAAMQDDIAAMREDLVAMREDLAVIRAILLSQQQPARSGADDADSLSAAQSSNPAGNATPQNNPANPPYGWPESGFPLSRE